MRPHSYILFILFYFSLVFYKNLASTGRRRYLLKNYKKGNPSGQRGVKVVSDNCEFQELQRI
jgi:hypothetical protein